MGRNASSRASGQSKTQMIKGMTAAAMCSEIQRQARHGSAPRGRARGERGKARWPGGLLTDALVHWPSGGSPGS